MFLFSSKKPKSKSIQAQNLQPGMVLCNGLTIKGIDKHRSHPQNVRILVERSSGTQWLTYSRTTPLKTLN